MPWVISFIISWILFIILVDRSRLKVTVWGGVLALILGSIVDWGGQQLQLYTFRDIIIPWAGCSAFYKFGPIFTIGILYIQSLPKKKFWQVLNIFVFSIIYLSLEFLIIQTNAADYIHWHILASLLINLLAFSSMTWFAQTFIKPVK